MHSGYYGGAALNAIHVLMQALSAVARPRRSAAGRAPRRARRGARRSSRSRSQEPAEGRRRCSTTRVRAARRERGRRLLRPDVGRAVARHERHPGRQARFVNTTLIVEAAARFTVRLAPGQDPERIAAAVERLIRAGGACGASVELIRENSARAGCLLGGLAGDPARAWTRSRKRPASARCSSASAARCRSIPRSRTKGIPHDRERVSRCARANVHSPNERLRVEDIDRARRRRHRAVQGTCRSCLTPGIRRRSPRSSPTTCSNASCATSRSTRSPTTIPRPIRAR